VRVGDYRIVDEVFDRLLVVQVVRIGHRREVRSKSILRKSVSGPMVQRAPQPGPRSCCQQARGVRRGKGQVVQARTP
jgi:hypothetical protein